MPEYQSIDFSQPMPLFPLTEVVVFPHCAVPLHIFEPRYRRMVADALEAQGLLAMALLAPTNQHVPQENLPLREHVCLGHIVRHQERTDGRYDMLLQGICRAIIVEEVPHSPYRMALLKPTETQPLMEIDLGDTRQSLNALLEDPTLIQIASIHSIHRWLNPEVPTLALIDLALLALCENPQQRYELLAEPDAQARARWLERHLRQTRHILQVADRNNPDEMPDGAMLN